MMEKDSLQNIIIHFPLQGKEMQEVFLKLFASQIINLDSSSSPLPVLAARTITSAKVNERNNKGGNLREEIHQETLNN